MTDQNRYKNLKSPTEYISTNLRSQKKWHVYENIVGLESNISKNSNNETA